MTHSNSASMLDPEQRLKALVKQVKQHQQLWILTDEHGCVMLNSEDEDCAPVWPSQETAQAWATGEWSECQPLAISWKDWQLKWTNGLAQDEVCVAVYPEGEQDGLVLTPDEFEYELQRNR